MLLGIGDDAALLDVPKDSDLAVAVDTIVAGRHFPEGSDARSIGHRALAVNLSDMAAMGAVPAWATLALTMPGADAAWLEKFAAGFLDLADAHAVVLIGGDTTRGPLTVSVQILGRVPHGSALRRAGARARRHPGGQRHVGRRRRRARIAPGACGSETSRRCASADAAF